MTLNELYVHVYDLVSLILTTEGITAEVFQSDMSAALPVTDDPYIVVGYTPTILRKIGATTFGDVHDPSTEEPPSEDPSYLVYYTPYAGEVEIRQVNGDGNLLMTILSSLRMIYVSEFLTEVNLSLPNIELAITSIPFRIDNKVHKESIVSPTFSFYDSRRENLNWIEDVNIGGEIENIDGSETRILEITNDSVAP